MLPPLAARWTIAARAAKNTESRLTARTRCHFGGGDLVDATERADAGVVDEHVEPTPAVVADGSPARPRRLRRTRRCPPRRRRHPAAAQLVDDAAEAIDVAVGERHRRPLGAEAPGGGGADPRRRSRDDGDPPDEASGGGPRVAWSRDEHRRTRSAHPVGRQAVVAVQVRRRGDEGVLVARCRAGRCAAADAGEGDRLGHRGAEAADDVVLLDDEDATGLAVPAALMASTSSGFSDTASSTRTPTPSAASAVRGLGGRGDADARGDHGGVVTGADLDEPARRDDDARRRARRRRCRGRPARTPAPACRRSPARTARIDAASHGASTVSPAIARVTAMSSMAWCDVP